MHATFIAFRRNREFCLILNAIKGSIRLEFKLLHAFKVANEIFVKKKTASKNTVFPLIRAHGRLFFNLL
jgi:hypothetical protein